MTPSTPGVHRPRFVVVRRTATSLAARERESNRCRDCTSRHRFSRAAFAIRTCSRLTLALAWAHSMDNHSSAASDGAAACAVSCSPSFGGSADSLATEHQADVGSLSGRGMLGRRSFAAPHPVSDPLQVGLGFFRPLSPAAPWARLTACCPQSCSASAAAHAGSTPWELVCGGLRGSHVSHEYPGRLGPACTPVARHLRRATLERPFLATCPFGPSLSAPLACRRLRRCSGLRVLTILPNPSSPPPCGAGRVGACPRGLPLLVSQGLRCPESSAPGDYSPRTSR